MNNRGTRIALSVFIVLILLSFAFGGGWAVGRYLPIGPSTEVTQEPLTTPVGADEATPAELQNLFTPFWEAWNMVQSMYVDQPVDENVLMEGAIRGMIEALGDQYSGYWTVQETSDANMRMSGEYDGIGAWVSTEGEYLTIVNPMPNSPAEEAGMKTGDQIIAVDGEDVTNMDPSLVRILKVLGPAGTDVTLTILREGIEDPIDVTITRAHIIVPSVESSMQEDNIGYVHLFQFGERGALEVHEALVNLLDQGAKGIILDLRDNPGGYPDIAMAIVSEFINKGVIYYSESNDGTRIPFNASRGGVATDIPLVVLVNEWSASASEIAAGALQDHDRAPLVGVTTFGKGLVQSLISLSNGGTARITSARWLTPDGRTIHEQGLTPDYIVEITEEDIANDRDPQLEKAIQVLQEMIAGGMD